MDKILEYLKNPKYAGVAGLLLGIFIGLVILGWGLFPVRWTDAAPAHLRQDYRLDYLKMAVGDYSVGGDAQRAVMRWEALGDEAASLLDGLRGDASINTTDLEAFSNEVRGGLVVVGIGETSTPASPGTVESEGQERTGVSPLVMLLLFCLLTLIVGGALVYVLLLRKKQARAVKPPPVVYDANRVDEQTEFYQPEVQNSPAAQFTTTYVYGDDGYDDSYSIDTEDGEFLGECGVGISEIIGVGEPKKVTAFEVWLFDKNDIQTITKVLLSEHAYNDEIFRQGIMAKGEPVLLLPGSQIILETATLQLEARIKEADYGESALPENSFFERLSIELTVWPKR